MRNRDVEGVLFALLLPQHGGDRPVASAKTEPHCSFCLVQRKNSGRSFVRALIYIIWNERKDKID